MYTKIKYFAVTLGIKKIVFLLCILATISMVTAYFFREKTTETSVQPSVRSVSVRSVAELSEGGSALATAGVVNAQSQATIRAERGGELTAVHASLGQYVNAGVVLAEMNNSSERAAILQAQGSLAAAEANSARVAKGSRAEAQAVLQTSLSSARNTAVTTLLITFASVNNSVKNTADSMMSNPESASPIFNIVTSNSQAKNDLQNKRLELTTILRRQAQQRETLQVSTDLNTELSKTQAEVRVVLSFYDSLITALNSAVTSPNASETQIATFKTNTVVARAELTTLLNTIDTARAGITNAGQNLNASTGPTAEDTLSAEATVTQARGALAAARASYEKSILRAPISGTLNVFSLKRGDFISAGQEVATIANNNALEVVTYVTQRDSSRIAVGNKITLDDGTVGTITKIAPAIDAMTKKIEVRIGLPTSAKLINGQSVVVTLDKATNITKSQGPITIPISTLKVGSKETFVFTVDNKQTLVAHTVKLGLLLGDRVEILEGIAPEMLLVLDARGHKEGDVVITE